MSITFADKPTAFQVMAKPIGPICNLNCTYCYYLEKKKIYPNTSNYKMSDQVLEEYIRQLISSQQVPVVSFVWQGGEPTLLGIDYFKKVIALQKKYNDGKRIENSFQTNGTYLNDDWCKFFKDHNFLVGISIDGPEEVHDFHRLHKDGRGSWDEVMKGIELLQKNNTEFNTLSVVNKHNSYFPLEIYRFLKDIGSQYIQFIPIVERIIDDPLPESLNLTFPAYGDRAQVTSWSVEPHQYGRFLSDIFDEWVRSDVGKYFVQLFDVTLANWVGEMPGLCVFSETCGDAAVLEHNGDLYTCDHFVYPEYYLGNILQKSMLGLMKSEKQIRFGLDKLKKLPVYCMQCEYRFACHGECPKHRFTKTPEGEDGLNYLCEAYKHFFEHVHPYMQYMSDELKNKRAPANVMTWVRQKDVNQSGKSLRINKPSLQPYSNKPNMPGRNDPCICGSGKKFKNCCMNKFPGL